MNKDEIKGTANKAKGAVKEAAGNVTGNDRLKAEGKIDKVKGAAQQAAGKVKDAAKKL